MRARIVEDSLKAQNSVLSRPTRHQPHARRTRLKAFCNMWNAQQKMNPCWVLVIALCMQQDTLQKVPAGIE
jgi:hypothetical protein